MMNTPTTTSLVSDLFIVKLAGRTGNFPSHLIFAFRHREHAATGRETFSTGVSRGMSAVASRSSTAIVSMVLTLRSYLSKLWYVVAVGEGNGECEGVRGCSRR